MVLFPVRDHIIKFEEFANKSIETYNQTSSLQNSADMISSSAEQSFAEWESTSSTTPSHGYATIPTKPLLNVALPYAAMLEGQTEDAQLFTPNILNRKYQRVTPQEVLKHSNSPNN